MPIVFSRVIRIHLDDEFDDTEGQELHDTLEDLFEMVVRTEFDDLALASIDPRLRLEIAE